MNARGLRRGLAFGLAILFAGMWGATACAQTFRGDRTIPAGQLIENDVTVIDVTLTVRGKVQGDVRQIDVGSIIVDGGDIHGTVTETEGGQIVVKNLGKIEGPAVNESGNGTVEISANGKIEAVITERDAGNIVVSGSEFEGTIREFDFGSIRVIGGSDAEGTLRERGQGTIVIFADSSFEGTLNED